MKSDRNTTPLSDSSTISAERSLFNNAPENPEQKTGTVNLKVNALLASIKAKNLVPTSGSPNFKD